MNTVYLIPIITAIFVVGITAFISGYVAGLKACLDKKSVCQQSEPPEKS
jgi:hypothetical protein